MRPERAVAVAVQPDLPREGRGTGGWLIEANKPIDFIRLSSAGNFHPCLYGLCRPRPPPPPRPEPSRCDEKEEEEEKRDDDDVDDDDDDDDDCRF